MNRPDSIRRILVGADTRGLSQDALVRAFDLAGRFEAELDVLHVVEAPLPRGPVVRKEELAKLNGEAFAKARAEVEERVAKARAANSDVKLTTCEVETVPGHVAEALLKRAEATGADLLVIGPHAERKLFEFGSTTRAVLGHSPIPVWNQTAPVEPIERVLVPIDFSDHSRAAVHHAIGYSVAFGAPLTLLHCYVPPSFAYDPDGSGLAGANYVVEADRDQERGELERWIAELEETPAVSLQSIFAEGDPRIAVSEERRAGDLVVMGTQGRSGFSRFLLGSVAHATVRDTEGAVVVVPGPEAD
ncbi:universal stress protein [Engelhardtia mirabilis]|uniref:Universal stress protein n=1 Tax=Engelhardtia mirabilis TaxID=2528011 RepID=A0A518BGF5_9BACT|nr:Universal stress protein [Planctomycetes bacterium Pla133]QDV00367.1 Universal stress protein [Planctomycetes bacterium Pla86]